MTTVVEHSELVRKALAWMDEHRCQEKPLLALLDEAGMHFNLSPRDQEFLKSMFLSESQETAR
ncbi:hypothetical protein JCM15519_01610 [Fundidesulfovibrio butyratiphilus]